MKWFLLLVIFGIVQYQETAGFPRNKPLEWHSEIKVANAKVEIKDIKREIEDLGKEIKNLFKPCPNSLRRTREIRYFPDQFTLAQGLKILSIKLQLLKYHYEETVKYLNEILKKYGNQEYDVTKDKDIKDQSTLEITLIGNKTQINATEVISFLDELTIEKPLINHAVLIRIPFKDIRNNILNYFSVKLESMKVGYKQMIENFKDIINHLTNSVTKDKDTRDQLTPENESDDKTQVNETQATTPDESVVNQQSTPDETDDEKKTSKDNKESLTSDNESTTLSDKTQENVTQTNFTPDQSENKNPKGKDKEETPSVDLQETLKRL